MDQAKTTVPEPADNASRLLDIAIVVAGNLRLLVLIPIAAGVLALGVTFLIPRTYTAVTRILPPTQQQGSSAALASQLGTSEDDKLS